MNRWGVRRTRWKFGAAVAAVALAIVLVWPGLLYAALPVAIVLPVLWVFVEVRNRHYAGLILGVLAFASMLLVSALGKQHQDGLYRGILRATTARSCELIDSGRVTELGATLHRFSSRLDDGGLSLWRALTALQHDLCGEGRGPVEPSGPNLSP